MALNCIRPEEVSGSSSGVALLWVEEEPVAMFKLLLRDVPAQLLDVDSTGGLEMGSRRSHDVSFVLDL